MSFEGYAFPTHYRQFTDNPKPWWYSRGNGSSNSHWDVILYQGVSGYLRHQPTNLWTNISISMLPNKLNKASMVKSTFKSTLFKSTKKEKLPRSGSLDVFIRRSQQGFPDCSHHCPISRHLGQTDVINK